MQRFTLRTRRPCLRDSGLAWLDSCQSQERGAVISEFKGVCVCGAELECVQLGPCQRQRWGMRACIDAFFDSWGTGSRLGVAQARRRCCACVQDAAAGAASDLGVDDVRVESEQLAKLTEQKEELLARVTGLKKELGDWRGKLDGQVKSFQGVSMIANSGQLRKGRSAYRAPACCPCMATYAQTNLRESRSAMWPSWPRLTHGSTAEIADLRKTLNTEVDSLRSEFVDLKSALKTQLELTQGLSVTQHVPVMFTSDVKHIGLVDCRNLSPVTLLNESLRFATLHNLGQIDSMTHGVTWHQDTSFVQYDSMSSKTNLCSCNILVGMCNVIQVSLT
eukprot:320552-Chlamydomonas_euryale.AAC.43